MNVSFHLYTFFFKDTAFLSQYARIIQQRWRFWASLYSQSKLDFFGNLNFRYKGELKLPVLLLWLVKRDELRFASEILLIYLLCEKSSKETMKETFSGKYLKKKKKVGNTHFLPRIQCLWWNTGSFDCAVILTRMNIQWFSKIAL